MADLPIRRGGSTGLSRGRSWDPFERLQQVMGLDPVELMGQFIGEGAGGGLRFAPAFEVKETKDAYLFKADLPGVEEKDLEVTVTGDRIQVSGKREEEKRDEGDRYYAYERSFGSFSRSFTLPEGVNSEGVEAGLKDGVLSIHVPKREEVQPKRIQLKSGEKSNKAGDKAKA